MRKLLPLVIGLLVPALPGCTEADKVTATPLVEPPPVPAPKAEEPDAAVEETEEPGPRAAGVQLGRMTVNEATSLQPLNETWKNDMHGILQVARNNQWDSESLLAALKRMSPRVGGVVEPSDGRQQWTGSLPARGIGAPEMWLECDSIEMIDGKRVSKPEGCDGKWINGAKNWDVVRSYAIELVAMPVPPKSVQGKPITWGGVMDIAEFRKERPNLCWLESGDTKNYFFGAKNDPENQCKEIPQALVAESKVVSARIVRNAVRRKTPLQLD